MSVLANNHRAGTAAIKKHAVFSSQIGKFLKEKTRRDIFAHCQEQQFALLIDGHGGSGIRDMTGTGPNFAVLQGDPFAANAKFR